MNSIVDDPHSHCLTHCMDGRRRISAGESPTAVLGNNVLDVSAIIRPELAADAHPFTQWVIEYMKLLGGHAQRDWRIMVASAYVFFHLMRVSMTTSC